MSSGRSNVIDTSSLCIHPGKAVWVLYVDLICINYDGNVLDAAFLSVIAALKQSNVGNIGLRITSEHKTPARLPKATYDEETDKTTCSRDSLSPLNLRCTPLVFSFGIFDL